MKKMLLFSILITLNACAASPAMKQYTADIDTCKKRVGYTDTLGQVAGGAVIGAGAGAIAGGSIDDSYTKQGAVIGAKTGAGLTLLSAAVSPNYDDARVADCLRRMGHKL